MYIVPLKAKPQFFIITFARCTLCSSDFSISHGGRNDVTSHEKTNHHKEVAKEASTSKSLFSFFRPQTQQSVIKAETLWSVFTAKHNLAF